MRKCQKHYNARGGRWHKTPNVHAVPETSSPDSNKSLNIKTDDRLLTRDW